MTREQKRSAKANISGNINQWKSRLIGEVRALEEIGCFTDAERLSCIIGRLEDFQNKRLK